MTIGETTACGPLGVPACRVVERSEFDDPFLMQAGYFELIDTDEVGRLRVTAAFTH